MSALKIIIPITLLAAAGGVTYYYLIGRKVTNSTITGTGLGGAGGVINWLDFAISDTSNLASDAVGGSSNWVSDLFYSSSGGENKVNNFKFGVPSITNMIGVHSDLKAVAYRALEITPYDFGVTCGTRSASEQNALYKEGKSQLDGYNKISRHQTGHAIDIKVYDENGKITWDIRYFKAVAGAFKMAANELNIPIIWGGDWTSLVDGPHFELNKSTYR